MQLRALIRASLVFLPHPSLLFFVYACVSTIFSFPAPYLTALCSLYRPTSCFQNALFMHCCTLVCMDTMPILWTISTWTLFFFCLIHVNATRKRKKKPRASIIWPHLLC
ncbi:hypothetical protein BC940DRAFT_290762 [Gongronella butleri]|nr:hypothetical protein BC940DRAFT_290762 [Gongronella butleri]